MSSQERRRPRTTLNDVALRAGVSATTASLVLGGKAKNHRIATATYQRVQEAASDLDYSPNLLVHSIQRGRTHVVSFYNSFRHRLTNDLYMDQFSTAVENAAGRYGYDVLVNCNFRRSPEDAYRFLNGGQADGMLFFAPLSGDPLLPLLRESRLPVVIVNSRDEAGVLPSVRDDVHQGMRQVAEALIGLGHHRIAAVTEEGTDFRDARERISLLRSFLSEQGQELPERLVVPYRGDGRMVVQQILAEQDAPTAIFCWRDRLAYYLLEACEEIHIAVPEQVSIIGYDGVHWPAATQHVAASVEVDLQRVADASIRLLDRYIRGEELTVTQEVVPVSFQQGTTLFAPSPGREYDGESSHASRSAPPIGCAA